MKISIQQLEAWMQEPEGEHLDFKEARYDFDSHKLTKSCVALANEGGGKLILGVTDKIPRKVIGTEAFQGNLNKQIEQIFDRIHLRIRTEEVKHPDGRVIVFEIPSRPVGKPLEYQGRYLMRVAGSLHNMTIEEIKKITNEGRTDYSSEINKSAVFSDLDSGAIEKYRRLWQIKSDNPLFLTSPAEQLLSDAGLIVNESITNAAMILFGKKEALRRHLAVSEVIFEYRSNEANIDWNQRIEYQQGFFLFYDELIGTINLRNDEHNFIDGLYRKTIKTFNEITVREAILNAVSHREYQARGSIFIKQFPRKMIISSPGGLPDGVTPENILDKQVPRNKLIAETFQRCGLVERSGRGFDRMYQESLMDGKMIPDLSGTDEYEVRLSIDGVVQDEKFVGFLEKVIAETQTQFLVEDLIVLDQVNRKQNVDKRFKERLQGLRESGVVEMISRGRGTQYLLSRKFYDFTGQPGKYTRKKGLDREQNKALLENHIMGNQGCQMHELQQVLPAHSRYQIKNLLHELKRENRIYMAGVRRSARWYPTSKIGLN